MTTRSVLPLLAFLLAASDAPAQEPKDEPCRVELPGITFTRSLNGAAAAAKVQGARLTLASEAKRDNFRDPDGKLSNSSAPVLLAEIDNTQPFTLTARVTPTFRETYDAGALYVWVREDLWLKMAMERDERGKTRIVTVRTTGTSDDNNHDVVEAKAVRLKISSDTKTIGFYYSLDARSWQLVRLFRNEYPKSIGLGVSAQSPIGNGNSVVFEDVALTKASIADFRMGL
jgi:hypothetical protein